MEVRILNLVILTSMFLLSSGCNADGTDGASSTRISASGQEGDSRAVALHAVDILHEDMTEAEVAAALEVTHIDEKGSVSPARLRASDTFAAGAASRRNMLIVNSSGSAAANSGTPVSTSERVMKL